MSKAKFTIICAVIIIFCSGAITGMTILYMVIKGQS